LGRPLLVVARRPVAAVLAVVPRVAAALSSVGHRPLLCVLVLGNGPAGRVGPGGAPGTLPDGLTFDGEPARRPAGQADIELRQAAHTGHAPARFPDVAGVGSEYRDPSPTPHGAQRGARHLSAFVSLAQQVERGREPEWMRGRTAVASHSTR